MPNIYPPTYTVFFNTITLATLFPKIAPDPASPPVKATNQLNLIEKKNLFHNKPTPVHTADSWYLCTYDLINQQAFLNSSSFNQFMWPSSQKLKSANALLQRTRAFETVRSSLLFPVKGDPWGCWEIPATCLWIQKNPVPSKPSFEEWILSPASFCF